MEKIPLLDSCPNSWTESQQRPKSPAPAFACSDRTVVHGHRAPLEGGVEQSQRGWMEISKGQLPELGITPHVASKPEIP